MTGGGTVEQILHLVHGAGGPEDRSARRQQVVARDVASVRGRSPGSRAMGFDGRRSRVIVRPSDAWDVLDGIRVSCWIWVSAVRGRHTIVEGYLAFALFIDNDGSIAGTVYDGFDWCGVQSSLGAVPVGRWMHVSFFYDGVDTCALYVDGDRCAVEYTPYGPAQGVAWPYGVNIGAWPDGDKRILDGRVEELVVWRLVGAGSGPPP